MKRALLIGSFAIIPFSALVAETEPAADVAETRQDSVANLEAHIAQREERLAEWGRDIVELDTRIEKRVESLVKLLADIDGTDDSDGGMTKIKQEAVAGLKRAMDAYAAKRREVAANAAAGDDAAAADLGRFDERIHKRVEQIAELAKSVPADPEPGEYQFDGPSYWNGYYFENTRLEEERNPAARRGKEPAAVRAIQRDIDLLDKRRSTLRNLLGRKTTEAAAKLYNRELGKLDAYKEHLNERLRALTLASLEAGETVPTDKTHDLTWLLDDARADLREDVSRLFRTYDLFAKGRTNVSQLHANLAARKKHLESGAGTEP